MASAGQGDLTDNLAALIEQLMAFFAQTFPVVASVFGVPALLAEHRRGVAARGGPARPLLAAQSYLDAERANGRLDPDADTATAARLLVGAAFHQGFLAAFEGLDHVPDALSSRPASPRPSSAHCRQRVRDETDW